MILDFSLILPFLCASSDEIAHYYVSSSLRYLVAKEKVYPTYKMNKCV